MFNTIILNAQSLDWLKSFGGILSELSFSLDIDDSSNILLCGTFQGTVDFNPDTNVYNHSSIGGNDVFIQKLDENGNFIWARVFGGNTNDQGNCIKVDTYGNVYTLGYFQGTVDFDPGNDTFYITSVGNKDVFIHKMDKDGNFIWARAFGGTANQNGLSMKLDTIGNIYLTGVFFGTVDFDPNINVYNITSNGSSDIFIQKLDSSGNLIWVKTIGGSSIELSNSIAIDLNENLYITGSFSNTVDFNPDIGVTNITSSGGLDIFMIKLNSNGNFIWAKSFGGSLDDISNYITIDANEKIHTTGYFQGTVDFDPGVSTSYLSAIGGMDVFIQKLDTNGNLLWIKSFGGISDEQGQSIITDSNGNIFTTGYFRGTVDFNPGLDNYSINSLSNQSIFIHKLDSSGNFNWVITHEEGDINSQNSGNALCLDNYENLYVTGYFQGMMNFYPETNNTYLNSNGGLDVYIEKINISTNTIFNFQVNSISQKLKTFPNPSNSILNLDYGNYASLNNYRVKITNALSQIIYDQAITQQTETIDLSTFGGAGIYYLSIINPQGNVVEVRKIVLQ
jgi:hypothetical protein